MSRQVSTRQFSHWVGGQAVFCCCCFLSALAVFAPPSPDPSPHMTSHNMRIWRSDRSMLIYFIFCCAKSRVYLGHLIRSNTNIASAKRFSTSPLLITIYNICCCLCGFLTQICKLYQVLPFSAKNWNLQQPKTLCVQLISSVYELTQQWIWSKSKRSSAEVYKQHNIYSNTTLEWNFYKTEIGK